ncbi:MAG: hypothetical protein ABIP95_03220 [Pelobium sp.]
MEVLIEMESTTFSDCLAVLNSKEQQPNLSGFPSKSSDAGPALWLCSVDVQCCHALGSVGSAGSIRKAVALAWFSSAEPIAIAVLRSSGSGFSVAVPSKNQRCCFYDGGGMVEKAPEGQKNGLVLCLNKEQKIKWH